MSKWSKPKVNRQQFNFNVQSKYVEALKKFLHEQTDCFLGNRGDFIEDAIKEKLIRHGFDWDGWIALKEKGTK